MKSNFSVIILARKVRTLEWRYRIFICTLLVADTLVRLLGDKNEEPTYGH